MNKRPKGKRNKKTVNPKDLIDDPPYAGDELRVNLPHPTVPSNLAMPRPSSAGEKALNPEPMYLLSYEEMMIDEMFNGPSSMETQSDLAPVQVLKEGAAVTQDGQTVEWWPMNESVANTELDEYLQDETKPLHTIFVLPDQGLYSSCPVFFGSFQNKQIVA